MIPAWLAALGLAALPHPLPPTAAAAAPAAARALPDRVDELIAEGRRLLDLGKPVEAEAVFLQAADVDPSFRTRLWILRARMDQPGLGNDTLDEIETLSREGHGGPEMDYLFGMAFARRAQQNQAAGLAGVSVRMNYQDAIRYLKKALAAEPDRFADAFQPLALAAWFESDLETARAAADEAAKREPQDPEAHLVRGRVAFSQFVAAKDDPARTAEADEAWAAARDSFGRAAELIADPRDAREEAMKADAALQLGHVHLWRQETEAARAAYEAALAADPSKVDLAQIRSGMGEEFRPLLEAAEKAFARSHREADGRDAALLWWLGYERFSDREYPEAEEAFRAALAKMPAFANAWVYVALARYEAKDWKGVADALRAGWEIDPPGIVRELAIAREANAARLEYVIGQAVQRGDLADAALVAEALAELQPDEPRHWNNLGLFLRDEGERLTRAGGDPKLARRLFERSLTAYERALALRPDDPSLQNDTAVILHYYLDQDLDRARTLYERAAARAEELLAKGDLKGDELELVRVAKRDATNNLEALATLLAERAAAAAKAAEEERARQEPPVETPPVEGEGGDGGGDAGEGGSVDGGAGPARAAGRATAAAD